MRNTQKFKESMSTVPLSHLGGSLWTCQWGAGRSCPCSWQHQWWEALLSGLQARTLPQDCRVSPGGQTLGPAGVLPSPALGDFPIWKTSPHPSLLGQTPGDWGTLKCINELNNTFNFYWTRGCRGILETTAKYNSGWGDKYLLIIFVF